LTAEAPRSDTGAGFRAPTYADFETSLTEPQTLSDLMMGMPDEAPAAEAEAELSFDDMLVPDEGFELKRGASPEDEPAPPPVTPATSYAEFVLDIDEEETATETPEPDSDDDTPAPETAEVDDRPPEAPRSVFPDQDADVFTIMEIEPESAFDTKPAPGEAVLAETTELPLEERALDSLPARRSGRTWGIAVLAGLLIAVLGAQLALVYRQDLVQAVPATRPFIELLCANLGCDMSLPHDPRKISIEASDLNRLPDASGVYVLSATLTNRAEVAQAFPHLELTLTDATDRPVIRKVLTPAQWLGHTPDEAGFAAGATRAIEVRFTAEDVSAAGYRLYAFYP
jgi:hypothetical protein